MQHTISPSKTPFAEYVRIPSLEYTEDLAEALNAISFSLSPMQHNSQTVSMKYTEGDDTYTLGRYDINYDQRARTTITSFATANMRAINPSVKTRSGFSSHIHLLRKPVLGLGTKLFEHLIFLSKLHALPCIKISSDKQSVPFYQKMAERFSDSFVRVDTDDTVYRDGGRDFTFVLKYS